MVTSHNREHRATSSLFLLYLADFCHDFCCPCGGSVKKNHAMEIIARIRTDFTSKFGIPRQSGLVASLRGTVVFEPAYRNVDALRGLEGFSHIWLIWQFSESLRTTWSPTVRPPRLGGDKRMGVFATRSPFRPNGIGLSSVQLLQIELQTEQGPVLHVAGVDVMDNTPLYDIKPYLAYTDSHPQATVGFVGEATGGLLAVAFPQPLLAMIPPTQHQALLGILAQDPRPRYQDDSARVYGLGFAGFNIQFTVCNDRLIVCAVTPEPSPPFPKECP